MKINFVAFFVLILLASNAFGMQKEYLDEQIRQLAVNKSGTLLCSVSSEREEWTRIIIINIWRIVSKSPQTTSLLKMKGPKSFLQSLPQELIVELQKFAGCCVPQSLVKIQCIRIGIDSSLSVSVKFDSDDNLYCFHYPYLQIWQKKDTQGKINYACVGNLADQHSFCLNSNILITRPNSKSITIFNVLKQTDQENPIALEVAQTIPTKKEFLEGILEELSPDSFLLSNQVCSVKVYKKMEGVALYALMKKIKHCAARASFFKGPSESIIMAECRIADRVGRVWLKENNSHDKPSYEFCIKYQRFTRSYKRIIWADELGRLYCKTPQNTIDILHNTDPLNPQNYQTIAQLPYLGKNKLREYSPITLSSSGTLFIGQGADIKIWHLEDLAKIAGFEAIIFECIPEQRKEKDELVKLASKERFYCIVC